MVSVVLVTLKVLAQLPGFSLTFEVEGHWLVRSQVPVKVRAKGLNL